MSLDISTEKLLPLGRSSSIDMSKEGRWYVYRTGQCPKCKTELTKNKKVR
jgi:hypothetical protein